MLAECLRYTSNLHQGLFQDGPRAEKAHQLLHPLMLG